jgi:site-specific recombinase XerD
LANEIKIRQYSQKTLKSYANWAYKLKSHSQIQAPQALNTSDVKSFLTLLAVEKNMSASSQNLTFNALLFFFRHVLGREFGSIDGVVRAKRKPYIPVVLTREEIDTIIQHLTSPFDLVVQLQ